MRKLTLTAGAWDSYVWSQLQESKTFKRMHDLIKDAQCDPSAGIGKWKALEHILPACWSRRIDGTNRLV